MGAAMAGGIGAVAAAGSVMVVGSLNADLVVTLPRLPAPGETVLGRTLSRFPGGKGLNQAVAAARMNATVLMVGAVGDDDTGRWLRETLHTEGIGADDVQVTPGSSGTALIEVDDDGRNRIVVVPGANDGLTADQARRAVGRHDAVAVVLAQGETPIETVHAAMQAAHARGVRTILNPAPVRDFPDALLALIDVLIPNEHEAAALSGLPTTTADECRAAAEALLRRGPRAVIVTRGEHGALVVDAHGHDVVPTFPVTPVDTVAAGDAFCGALAASLAAGAQLRAAIRVGCAAGALATTIAGAVPSLPGSAAVTALLDG